MWGKNSLACVVVGIRIIYFIFICHIVTAQSDGVTIFIPAKHSRWVGSDTNHVCEEACGGESGHAHAAAVNSPCVCMQSVALKTVLS